MNCKKCNAELEEGMKFCPSCGADQAAEESKAGLGAGKIALLVVLAIAAVPVVIALVMGGKGGKPEAMGFEITADMMTMMNGFTVLRLFTLMGGMADVKVTKEQLLDLNAQLNKIKAKD